MGIGHRFFADKIEKAINHLLYHFKFLKIFWMERISVQRSTGLNQYPNQHAAGI
jgi:hypothetical protein